MQSSIVTRLYGTAFGAYLVVACVVVALEVWANYAQTRTSIQSQLGETQNLIEQGLANAVWYVDRPLQSDLISGLLNQSDILAVSLLDTDNQLLSKAGLDLGSSALIHRFPLHKPGASGADLTTVIGFVELHTSRSVVVNKMLPTVVGMLVSALAKATALWLIFVYFGRKMVAVPLLSANKFVWTQLPLSYKSDAPVSSLDEISALDQSIRALSEHSKQELSLKILEFERLLARMNDVATSGRVGFFCHDIVKDVFTCNDAWRDIYELPEEQYPVVSMDDTASRFDPVYRDQYIAERITARLVKEMTIHNRELVMPDGRRKSVAHYMRPEYSEGRLVAMTGSAVDMTEQVERENRLNELISRQKEMFAVIGHELRTPVAMINMLMNDEGQNIHERDLQIKQLSENLLHVLEDLRVVIMPERAVESKKVVDDPVKVVERALNPLAPLISENGMKLTTRISQPESRAFALYAQQLRQTVTNLVKNAAIHSGGTEIFVSFGYKPSKDGGAIATLCVEDNGKGIAENLREKVFEAFGRGDTQSDGSGLGLFIVKQLVERLDGELSYATSQHGGACFTVTFPLSEGEIWNQAQTEPHETHTLDGMRVLLAEDEATLRMLTERSLANKGAKVTSVANGRLAMELFTSKQFDLVLTDLMMPEMDGHELTRAIRAIDQSTPIIAVTAAVIGAETEQFLSEGANAVVPKPLTSANLISVLEQIKNEEPELV